MCRRHEDKEALRSVAARWRCMEQGNCWRHCLHLMLPRFIARDAFHVLYVSTTTFWVYINGTSRRLWKCMRWKLHGEQTVRFAHLCGCFFLFFTNLTDVCKCLKKPMKKKDHKRPRRSTKSQPHRCGKHWGTEKAEQHLSRTFLLHSQLDVLGDQNCGRKEVELKSA